MAGPTPPPLLGFVVLASEHAQGQRTLSTKSLAGLLVESKALMELRFRFLMIIVVR